MAGAAGLGPARQLDLEFGSSGSQGATGDRAPIARRGLQVGSGPRVVERRLIAAVEADLAEMRCDPSLLARPIRIVVPSRSLRLHVGSLLVAHRGRAVAGVSVRTLYGIAGEVVARIGESPTSGDALLPALVRVAAREESVLRNRLDDLVDGYGVVEATVRDLLDAGFEPALGSALEERIASAGRERERVAIAQAVVRVARKTSEGLDALHLQHSSALFRRAAEVVAADPERALPAHAVYVHGFSDATGVQTDLLEALLRHTNATVFLDEPPGFDDRTAPDPGVRFSQRFRERLESVAPASVLPDPPLQPPRLEAIEAHGSEAEVRAVARRLRRLLDAGARPESLAVVARDLTPHAYAIRLHFRRLAIPFSGLSAGGPGGARRRRLGALLDLLREGERAPTDRWLDALVGLAESLPRAERADLRLALRHLGAARLADVERIDASEDLPLPVRRGLLTGGDADGVPHAARRRAPARLLETAVQAARSLCRQLRAWPQASPVADHVARLRVLLAGALGWDTQGDVVFEQLSAFERDIPGRFELRFDDFVLLLVRALGGQDEKIGGEGGGVQVLTVMEARARSFDRLFLLGLNRDEFPRSVSEDPLLPDALRVALADLLPDIPIKSRGFDEERFLFAQLLDSSPQITLSWQASGDDARPRALSSLMVRLRFAYPDLVVEPAQPLLAAPEDSDRPAHELALAAALHESASRFEALFSLACEERARELGQNTPTTAGAKPSDLCAGRLAVLRELDAQPLLEHEGVSRLGPYFGFVGPVRERADPRRAPLYITTLEQAARCPWATFVERLLRLEAVPDPFEALPDVDPLLLGSAVHRVLERIVAESLPDRSRALDQVRSAAPVPVRWPDDAAVETRLREVVASLLAERATIMPGLAEVLIRRVRPLVARARELDWSGSGSEVSVVAVELQGEVEVSDADGVARSILFRADRVDQRSGALYLTDYKTGKPLSDGRRPLTRRKNFLEGVSSGKLLQAAAYARAASVVSGGYLYLKADLPEELTRFEVASDDAEFADQFERSVRTLLAGYDEGTFVPRLLDAEGENDGPQCRFCRVSEACLQGDSGAKRRLRSWLEARSEPGEGSPPSYEEALLGVWNLERKPSKRKARE